MTCYAAPSTFSSTIWQSIALITVLLLVTTGSRFYLKACSRLKNTTATMDSLVTLLSTSIICISLQLLLLKPTCFPANPRHYYFEASLMIIGDIKLGPVLEHHAHTPASEALNNRFRLRLSSMTLYGVSVVKTGIIGLATLLSISSAGLIDPVGSRIILLVRVKLIKLLRDQTIKPAFSFIKLTRTDAIRPCRH